jgi:hypothetical protein
MTRITRLNLLDVARRIHPDGVIDGARTLIYEHPDPDNNPDAFAALLREARHSNDPEGVVVLDLGGIDVLGPSPASAVIGGAARFTRDSSVPIVLINARPEVLKMLRLSRYALSTGLVLYALDEHGERHLVGELPERLRDVLAKLEAASQDDGASASDLAGLSKQEKDKRTINRFSVYLQELFNAGLVQRRKVGGSERQAAERGWTYQYRPAYVDIEPTSGA